MPDKIESQKIICSGGLNTSENFLLLSSENAGSAVRLVNYETSLTGGYRRINGFTPIDVSFSEVTSVTVPAEGSVLGIWGYVTTSRVLEVYAARKSVGSAVYRIYKFASGSGWTEQVTGIAHVSTGVSKLRTIYFNQAGLNWIVWVDGVNKATAFDGTNYYQLDSANTGGTLSPGGDQLIDAPAYIDFFKSTVFLGGINSVEQGIVSYSSPDDVLDWTAASGAGQMIPGFPVHGLKSFRDENFIFGETRISKAIPDVSAGFLLEPVTTDIGCLAPDSILEIGGDLIFLSSDGIRSVAGTDKIDDTDLGLLSQSIQNTVNDLINTYDVHNLVAVPVRDKAQFRYFLSDPAIDTSASYGIIGAVRSYNGDHKWEFGELLGIQASCAWSGYDGDHSEHIYHGDHSGFVYEQEVGSSFNGESITSIYTTPYLDFGDPMIRKLMRKLHIFIRAEGSITLDFAIRYDWDRSAVQNPADYQVSSTGSSTFYDAGLTYDDPLATYSTVNQPVFSKNIQGSGYSTQCSIVSEGIYDPYTIQGLIYEFSIKGRQLGEN